MVTSTVFARHARYGAPSLVGRVSLTELQAIDAALRLAIGLD